MARRRVGKKVAASGATVVKASDSGRFVVNDQGTAATTGRSKLDGAYAVIVDSAREAEVIHRAFERQSKTFKFTAGQRKALNSKQA